MAVACVGDCGGEEEVSDECGGLGLAGDLDVAQWNGREIAQLSSATQIQLMRAYMRACAIQEQIKTAEQAQEICKQYQVLDLREDLLEEHLFELQQSLACELYYPSDHEFAFACPSSFNLQTQECKSLLKRIVKAVKKTAKKVAHYVEEHKQEILIAAAILAVVAGACVLAGALTATAAADGGSEGKKEEDDPQIPAIGNAPPPEPNPPPQPLPESDPFAIQPAAACQNIFSNPSDLFQSSEPSAPVDPLSNLLPSMPPAVNLLSIPAPMADVPLPIIAEVFQTALGALMGIGRSISAPNMQDSYAPVDLFSTEEIERWKSEESHLANALFRPKQQDSNSVPFSTTPYQRPIDSPPRLLSRYFQTEGNFYDGMKVTFIQGMNNSFEEAKVKAEYIGKLGSNQQIHGIYNHSNTALLDAAEALFLNYKGFSPITQDLLINTWKDFHEKHPGKPDAKILHFCHSQGAIHTFNALQKLPKEIRDRVIVVSIAGAKVIPKDLCFDSFNYASENDLIHYGEDWMSQVTADVIAMELNPTLSSEVLNELARNKNQLILLKPHKDASGLDHDFLSPTFTDSIEWHLKDYHMHGGEYK